MKLNKLLNVLTRNIQADALSSRHSLELLSSVKRVFVTGAGRSGLVGKFFAMRLMHLGKEAYVVGETTTARIYEDDLLVAITGSGSTKTILRSIHVAKEVSAKIMVLTAKIEGEAAQYADEVIVLGKSKCDSSKEDEMLMPLGSAFELSSLLFLEALIAELMQELGFDESDLRERHTNLE